MSILDIFYGVPPPFVRELQTVEEPPEEKRIPSPWTLERRREYDRARRQEMTPEQRKADYQRKKEIEKALPPEEHQRRLEKARERKRLWARKKASPGG